MKVRNITNQEQEIPGTQPGYYFIFQPGETLEVPDHLGGFLVNDHKFQIIRDVVEAIEVKERTIICEVCQQVLKSKNEKFDKRIIAMHKGKVHKFVK